MKENRIPSYYIGTNGYEARKVVDGFELSYNVGTAVTYLLRAERKHDSPIECIQKAINHLEFELDKLMDISQKLAALTVELEFIKKENERLKYK